MKKIIGIIGPIGGGKDVAAQYISDKLKIPVFEISKPIKEIAKEKGIEATRENLIKLGNQLSNEFGSEYLAKLILNKINQEGIITGMRQIDQIKYLRENSDFILISINCKPEIRFKRAQERNKLGEALNYEKFIENEIKENSAPMIQRLFECMNMADCEIENEKTLNDLYNEIDKVLEKIQNKPIL